MAEPIALVLFGSAAALILERLFIWLWRQEQEPAYLRRERALAVYRERHPRKPRCSA